MSTTYIMSIFAKSMGIRRYVDFSYNKIYPLAPDLTSNNVNCSQVCPRCILSIEWPFPLFPGGKLYFYHDFNILYKFLHEKIWNIPFKNDQGYLAQNKDDKRQYLVL